ncbi:type I restriction-modification system subunit M [Microvirga massiliensis]|uniref:type I restriction-modification system subunit M n=1 Tax=Microvirga massiliensis TaxID=1033741 RepID=UPI00062BB184|nr:class I SAM-dependent DNA methyltransferase [Microvirga massiliensis]
MQGHSEKVAFIWSVADLLRGDYKASDYGKVILPFTVLRRLDCVLERTKDAVLKKAASLPASATPVMRETMLNMAAGQTFHNLSRYTFQRLKAEPEQIEANLLAYLNGFSSNVRDVFIDRFDLPTQVARLERSNLLFLIVSKFAEIDLHPERVSNLAMGYVFEELIRRFAEQSNETAGEHFTPREVIRLMVNLLLSEDTEALTQKGAIRTLYDPACGTGGMLSVAEEYLRELNPDAKLVAFGQELNPETYAVCKSDMLIKGQDPNNIGFGNSFSEDRFPDRRFDYCISNPPFGVEWKKIEKEIVDEHEKQGFKGRFGAGLPRVSDGSLLFVQHMVSKFRNDGGTSRLAVVLNGSPLFTGGAGSGESEIRRWIIENDWLEAIIGLPDQLFYNTGISTYVWIITNRKSPERKGKVQLIDATGMFEKMRKSLGNKRNFIPEDAIREVTRLFGEMAEGEHSKVLDNEDFGYWRITVERPLRLNFQIDPERIERVKEQSAFKALVTSRKKGREGETEIAAGKSLQAAALSVLGSLAGDRVWKDREEFTEHLKAALKRKSVKVPTPVMKAVLAGLSERDETAEPCLSGGEIEPDPELRDTENVPLKEDIATYMEREVLPHVPDAWVDESKTRKGYEIPFTRHFYQYVPPRPLEEIDADLRRLSIEIQSMLREIAA